MNDLVSNKQTVETTKEKEYKNLLISENYH